MTLDEAIFHAEEVAEEQGKEAKEWHENQIRKCELFPFAEMDYTHENECKKCAEEHRQLAEWLKDYKRLLKQEQKTGHWIKYGIPRCEEQHYQCSSCGYYINFGQWGELYTKEFKYCPNCGARMVDP